jgi:hypothetical protein
VSVTVAAPTGRRHRELGSRDDKHKSSGGDRVDRLKFGGEFDFEKAVEAADLVAEDRLSRLAVLGAAVRAQIRVLHTQEATRAQCQLAGTLL